MTERRKATRDQAAHHKRVSWQIMPLALKNAIKDPDPTASKRAFDAMMQMRKIDIAAIEAARRG